VIRERVQEVNNATLHTVSSFRRELCGGHVVLGNMSAVFVMGAVLDELKTVFDKLAVGADRERFQELHEMPFGTYGQFYDKYGVQWIFRGKTLS